jgi:hypothetical protein
MGRTLATRLAALKRCLQGETTHGWTPPEFPDDWYEEVLRLLAEYGYLESVLESWGCDTP